MVQDNIQVSYAGIRTFARAPEGTIEGLRPGQVAVMGVAHDGTSSSRQGVRWGPLGIRDASVDFIYNLQSSGTVVDILSGRTLSWPKTTRLIDLGDLNVFPTDLSRTERSLRDALASIINKGAFPIILGGDHYITFPLFDEFAKTLKQKGQKIGLIQLASSLDLADAHPLWGKQWHGATLRRIVESNAIDASNLVWLGVHGLLSYSEWEFAEKIGATVIILDSIREQGIAEAARRALEIAGQGCEKIYISLDIGVVDSSYAPGRGGVVVGGLTPEELLDLMRVLDDPKVAVLDVVEVAPPIDPTGRTPRLAAEAIIELIASRVFS
jgi:agmatinase